MARPASSLQRQATNLLTWVDKRLPVTEFWNAHLAKYYAPKNFNFWYYMGSLALLVLVIQIATGIFLTMHYKPSSTEAFASVEYIMRDVEWGWLIRYMHSSGASFFFIVVYLHMFRALLYGSHRKPRELLWIFGMFIYLLLMAEAFFGYVLPWGQMSYWGAQVIINLFGAIPTIGEPLTEWIRGDYFISDATLNRFFALHVIAVPIALLGLVVLHLAALHQTGSNNPDGIEIKEHKGEDGIPVDGVAFHPYYTVKDLFGAAMFLIVFAFVIFFWPEAGGLFLEHDNFVPADPLITPEHIKPVWYFTPFYAILKAVPDKLMGVVLMGLSVVVLFFVPWLDRSPVRSIRYKGAWYKILVFTFAIAFIRLGMLGMAEGTPAQTWEMRVWTFVYFAFFILLFFFSKGGKTKPVPDRVQH
ncbi:MAG: cytochrome bc complex cytochrome b subunit [Xanthomonadales bacterium]|nr:cytochrome bc complex cytochrome b subunit [Xanthomonadales bacterium]